MNLVRKLAILTLSVGGIIGLTSCGEVDGYQGKYNVQSVSMLGVVLQGKTLESAYSHFYIRLNGKGTMTMSVKAVGGSASLAQAKYVVEGETLTATDAQTTYNMSIYSETGTIIWAFSESVNGQYVTMTATFKK